MNLSCLFCAAFALTVVVAEAEPLRDWDWHMPADVYKNLEFTDRAACDRAVKLFNHAIDQERRGRKVTEIVPLYRNAAGEWRKVQMQAETTEGNEELLAYAVFMQGYAHQQAHDRNEAIKFYTEVLDLYPEQSFIAIPARYMISVVHRELGDTRRADEEFQSIVDDAAAGHVLYFNVLRNLGNRRWDEQKDTEACELWEKIVFNTGKGKPNDEVWRQAYSSLRVARVVNGDFANLERLIFRGLKEDDLKGRAKAVFDNASWFYDANRNYWAGFGQYAEARFPGDKNKAAREKFWSKMRTNYISWFETQKASCLDGYDSDGWAYTYWRLCLRVFTEKDEKLDPFIAAAERVAKASKDKADGRIHDVAWMLMVNGRHDRARACLLKVADYPSRIRWQIQMEGWIGAWKQQLQFIKEFIDSKPGPGLDELKGLKYTMADIYRRRTGEPEKAVKIYQELNDPPRSLWGLAEALRECGKKKESYESLMELISVFPGEAPNAVLRSAQWREADGEKEKAIGFYRQLMNHPKWKETSASSQAHQALERLGVKTGGAMTNEVR